MELHIGNTQAPAYRDEHLSIDLNRREVTVDARPITFTRKEYDLLSVLVQHAGEVVPRETLLMKVWGYSTEIRTRTLDMHLSRLRKQLRPYGDSYIERVFRIGCRFQPRNEYSTPAVRHAATNAA